jgi:hypothetical protein
MWIGRQAGPIHGPAPSRATRRPALLAGPSHSVRGSLFESACPSRSSRPSPRPLRCTSAPLCTRGGLAGLVTVGDLPAGTARLAGPVIPSESACPYRPSRPSPAPARSLRLWVGSATVTTGRRLVGLSWRGWLAALRLGLTMGRITARPLGSRTGRRASFSIRGSGRAGRTDPLRHARLCTDSLSSPWMPCDWRAP